MFDGITEGTRKWLVARFASAIRHSTRAEDRTIAIRWLSDSRAVIASDLSPTDKAKKLNSLVNSRTAITAIAKSVSEAVSNYRKSDLPLSMKIALPATLAAVPLVGGASSRYRSVWRRVWCACFVACVPWHSGHHFNHRNDRNQS